MNLKELSTRLRLSQTAVSCALNGYPEVSEAARKRVRTAAEEFGHSPSTRVKGLATGQPLAIGHVIAMSSQHEMVNPIFGDFIADAGENYSCHGFELILSVVADREQTQTYKALKTRRAVDGVIVHGSASRLTSDYDWLDVNNRSAFYRATDVLLDLRHKRIALVNGLETIFTAMRSSVRDAGRRVAELLLNKIMNPLNAPQNELLEAELMAGRSTGPVPHLI